METKLCKICGRELPLEMFDVLNNYIANESPLCTMGEGVTE